MINMKQGYTRKEALEIQKKLEDNGWKVEINNLDAIKKDDSAFWYEYDEDFPLLSIRRKNKKYEIIAKGDIDVIDPKNDNIYFHFEGGKPDTGDNEDMTDNLVKNGDWGNNNWFELIEFKIQNGKFKEILDVNNPNEIDLKEIIKDLFETLKIK